MILGIGTDLAEVSRVAALWETHREGLERRVFTDTEVAYCTNKARPAEHLAARFAAKEAALKALGTGWGRGVGLCEVEVVKGEDGPPAIKFYGKAADFAERMGVSRTWLSMSHSGDHAIAMVVLEGTESDLPRIVGGSHA